MKLYIRRSMARLIYMQSTIDLMHSKDPQMLNDLIKYGEPEIKEIIRDDVIKYYAFDID